MARHSKWANIKHRKAAADSKKGKVFTKMAKLITVAAQRGGGDMEMNPSLRMAVQKAKSAGVPADNIDRAIKKGTGELKGDLLEEITYEGYGPEGVALLIRCLTDNTNRSFGNVRTLVTKHGGNLGSSGCVAWLFGRKGVIVADVGEREHDAVELMMLDGGAEDLEWEENVISVTTSPESFEQCLKVFDGFDVHKSEITLVPFEEKEIVNVQNAQKIQKLLELLEEDEDVDAVFSNAVFPPSFLEK